MITADTITDEQIHELHEHAWDEYVTALRALGIHPHHGGGLFTEDERREARYRCAEILNARAAKP